jgi:beta-lactamase regulating signal transducer with metallopeptidase domain
MKSKLAAYRFGFGALTFLLLAVSLRMAFPFEITAFSNEIYITKVYPEITRFVRLRYLSIGNTRVYISHILFYAWVCGAAVKFVHYIRCYVRFKKNVLSFPEIKNERVVAILNEVTSGRRRFTKFKLINAPVGAMPFIIGVIKPVISLPAASLSDDELRYVLRHETSHFYNGDAIMKIALDILCIVYWWNPAGYLLRRFACEYLEVSTDMAAAKTMDETERINYAKFLLKVAKDREKLRMNNYSFSLNSYAVSFLQKRISVLAEFKFYNKVPKRDLGKMLILLATAVITMAVSFVYVFEARSVSSEDAQNTYVTNNESTFMVRRPDGSYDMYSEGVYIGVTKGGDDPIFDGIQKYESLEEVLQNEKIKIID